MEFIIYFKTILFFSILAVCGVIFFKRAVNETRTQIIIPGGIILGIAFYIFLVNAVAHLIKGAGGFYIALSIQIMLAVAAKKFITTDSLSFPKKRNYLLFVLTLIIFIPFLAVVTAQGPANTADSFMHYSLAAVFQRGDYPPHVPWQPDYISYYHLGMAEFLGAMRAITSGSFEFLFAFIELIIISCIAIILPWLYKTEKPNFLIFFAAAAFGILSLGSFWLSWPSSFDFSTLSEGFFSWLKHLPTLAKVPAMGYGTQTDLISFMLFSHRVLAIAFVIATLVILLSPKRNCTSFSIMIILLSAIALTDESVFVSIAPAIFLVSFFTFFKKSFLKSLLFVIICLSIVILQGGILSYLVFNPSHIESNILIFPSDQKGPQAPYEKYRSERLNSLGNTFISTDATHPLNFFNLGTVWRLILITSITLLLLFRYRDSEPILKIILILCLASFLAMIEFVVIVPKGYLHANGSRFFGLSYYFSGLAIIYLIYLFWEKSKYSSKVFKWIFNLIKILIVWTLVVTIIPSIAILFPLQKYNWYANSAQIKHPLYTWVRQNIPQEDRVLLLVENSPTANVSANLSLISQEGFFTPIWSPEIKVFYGGGEPNPAFFDIFYTLNPSTLKLLKVKYLVLGNQYLSQLPKERIADLNNNLFFHPILSSDMRDLTILKIQSNYFEKGSNFRGTFTELSQIAPFEASYYIEDPPVIGESMYRATRLVLADRKLYYRKSVAFYNYQIDVTLKYYGESAAYYDYLILGKNTDPETICLCQTELVWSGLGNSIRLWKTK